MGNQGLRLGVVGGGHRLRLGEVPKRPEGEVRKRPWCRSKCERKTAAGGFKKYRSARAAPVQEMRFGARSAAGSMTALSLGPNVRGHGFQMHHYRNCAGDPLSRGFEPLSLAYFSLRRQREVSAAPHRGNANKPIRNQGKANAASAQKNR